MREPEEIKISEKTLAQILEEHKHWLCEDCEGWRNMRAYLRNADLSGAYLSGADLRNAYLSGADLRNAYLSGADLSGAKNIPLIPLACPEVGSFTAFKKAHGAIVTLEIPADAKRCSGTGRKCRCDKAKVLRIEREGEEVCKAVSYHDESFIYEVGEVVSVNNFEEDRFKECAPGIHFFINRQEAEDYDG